MSSQGSKGKRRKKKLGLFGFCARYSRYSLDSGRHGRLRDCVLVAVIGEGQSMPYNNVQKTVSLVDWTVMIHRMRNRWKRRSGRQGHLLFCPAMHVLIWGTERHGMTIMLGAPRKRGRLSQGLQPSQTSKPCSSVFASLAWPSIHGRPARAYGSEGGGKRQDVSSCHGPEAREALEALGQEVLPFPASGQDKQDSVQAVCRRHAARPARLMQALDLE